jgi:hypothetical protein
MKLVESGSLLKHCMSSILLLLLLLLDTSCLTHAA